MSYAPIRSETVLNKTSTYERLPSSSRSRQNSHGQSTPSKRRSGMDSGSEPSRQFPIIVHCHLCWDWVWQRPQQFLSRLSQRHKILFVETVGPDPELAAPLAKFKKSAEFPNITILRLQFPTWRWPDGAYVDRERRRLVQEFLRGPGSGDFQNPVQWFYDPMAVTAFAGKMGESLTVYDCMDELSKFRGAPPEIVLREAELLARADVVFTGGRRLYESKSQQNKNCHFYGCGVDAAHFGKARQAATVMHPALQEIAKPVLGYFGVIDERLDYKLIADLADANPEWSVVMVGPTIKVDPQTLPQRANLHWLGHQDYAALPTLCKGFDVCLMPFALNESTEYINPTKALEYMATGRLIVSTAVYDVVHNFGSVVKVAKSPEEFVQLCRNALEQSDHAAIMRGLEMVRHNSWDAIVANLEMHMAEALERSVAGVAL